MSVWNEIFAKQKMIFLVFLLALIIVGEVFFHYFGLATWPAFLVMVLFLLGHMEEANTWPILIGGLVGIFSSIPSKLFIVALAPSMGVFSAKLLFIVIFVTLILLLKDVLPLIFNTYAFLFLIVTALAAGVQDPNPIQWMVLQFVGGGIFIYSIMGIRKIVVAILTPKMPK